MSKKKGKDKSKIDNKPAYFDFTTLHVSSLQVIILSTILTSAGAYTPFITLVRLGVYTHFILLVSLEVYTPFIKLVSLGAYIPLFHW